MTWLYRVPAKYLILPLSERGFRGPDHKLNYNPVCRKTAPSRRKPGLTVRCSFGVLSVRHGKAMGCYLAILSSVWGTVL